MGRDLNGAWADGKAKAGAHMFALKLLHGYAVSVSGTASTACVGKNSIIKMLPLAAGAIS